MKKKNKNWDKDSVMPPLGPMCRCEINRTISHGVHGITFWSFLPLLGGGYTFFKEINLN